MSQKRAEKLLRRAKRQRKKVEWRAGQRFEDAVKVAEALARVGGVVHDEKTGEVIQASPPLMEAYHAGRLREALRDTLKRHR
jgi:hypothetical protein